MEKVTINNGGFNVNNNFESDSTGSLIWDTGLYQALLKYAYFGTTKKGDPFVNLVIEINGITKTFPVYIMYSDTHTTTKKGPDGKIKSMPGYVQMNSLAYILTDKTFDQIMDNQEEKVVKVFNWNTRKEEPVNVMALTDLCNKKICVGIKKMLKHKTALVNGQYLPTTDTFHTNEIDRFYTEDGRLAKEKAEGIEASYALNFKKKSGQVFEEKLSVTPIAPPQTNMASVSAGTAGTQVTSLFDD